MPFEKIMERSGGLKEATDVWVIRVWNFKTVYYATLCKIGNNLTAVDCGCGHGWNVTQPPEGRWYNPFEIIIDHGNFDIFTRKH